MCTCPDFKYRHMPCKHIFRLADELGLFQPEEFAPGEKDYTLQNTYGLTFNISAEDNTESDKKEILESIPSTSFSSGDTASNNAVHEPSVFIKIIKILCSCFFGFWTVFFLLGAATKGGNEPEWFCFPIAFSIAGFLTANTAKRKALGGHIAKWWTYGAFVPIVSWIDVTMADSQNKLLSFVKGIAYSVVGIMIFLVIFVQFLPPVTTH